MTHDRSAEYVGGIEVIELAPGEPVDLRGEPLARQFVPTEFYVLPQGSADDRPSLLILMRHPHEGVAVGQISYAMLKPVIEALERAEKQRG